MIRTDDAGSTPRKDLLTTAIATLLALVAGAGLLFCLLFAAWWLVTYWAPF